MIPIQPNGDIALIIPTLDEAGSIGVLLAEVPSYVSRIIVADGGSRDGTVEAARSAGAETIDAGRGYGRACLAGAQHASRSSILVFMDGDGADDPSEIGRLLAPIEAGTHDFVIGSRVHDPGARKYLGWHQRWAGRCLGWAMGALFGTYYTDMCAFRAIRVDAFKSLGMREIGYGWNLEMQMRCARAKLRILEIPVSHRARIAGQSKVAGSLIGSLKAGTKIILTFARLASASRGVPASTMEAEAPHR
jgi:glycosyltransferase involved in cell wall biosynthesis